MSLLKKVGLRTSMVAQLVDLWVRGHPVTLYRFNSTTLAKSGDTIPIPLEKIEAAQQTLVL